MPLGTLRPFAPNHQSPEASPESILVLSSVERCAGEPGGAGGSDRVDSEAVAGQPLALEIRGRRVRLVSPRLYRDEYRAGIRSLERRVLGLIRVADFLAATADAEPHRRLAECGRPRLGVRRGGGCEGAVVSGRDTGGVR